MRPELRVTAMLLACAVSMPALAASQSATLQPAAPQSPQVIGEARSLENGELRYRELHTCRDEPRSCTVEYLQPDGELFARKELDYSQSPHAPQLVMHDHRLGTTIELLRAFEADTVVDAGFDNYVRSRWQELADGEDVVFPFVVAGRDSALAMRAEREERADCPATGLCLLVRPNNWLLDKLVDPIRLTYDERRKLVRFAGISNIRDQDGRSQDVEISYTYPLVSPP